MCDFLYMRRPQDVFVISQSKSCGRRDNAVACLEPSVHQYIYEVDHGAETQGSEPAISAPVPRLRTCSSVNRDLGVVHESIKGTDQ